MSQHGSRWFQLEDTDMELIISSYHRPDRVKFTAQVTLYRRGEFEISEEVCPVIRAMYPHSLRMFMSNDLEDVCLNICDNFLKNHREYGFLPHLALQFWVKEEISKIGMDYAELTGAEFAMVANITLYCYPWILEAMKGNMGGWRFEITPCHGDLGNLVYKRFENNVEIFSRTISTKTLWFKEEDEFRFPEKLCIICEEEFTDGMDVVKLERCGHYYHGSCLLKKINCQCGCGESQDEDDDEDALLQCIFCGSDDMELEKMESCKHYYHDSCFLEQISTCKCACGQIM